VTDRPSGTDRQTDRQADRETDRPRYSVGNSRVYICSTAMQPKSSFPVPMDIVHHQMVEFSRARIRISVSVTIRIV